MKVSQSKTNRDMYLVEAGDCLGDGDYKAIVRYSKIEPQISEIRVSDGHEISETERASLLEEIRKFVEKEDHINDFKALLKEFFAARPTTPEV